jgi:hypothetical protein
MARTPFTKSIIAKWKPNGMTENPATFGCDKDQDPIEEVLGSLRLAIGTLEKEPILDEAEAFKP